MTRRILAFIARLWRREPVKWPPGAFTSRVGAFNLALGMKDLER